MGLLSTNIHPFIDSLNYLGILLIQASSCFVECGAPLLKNMWGLMCRYDTTNDMLFYWRVDMKHERDGQDSLNCRFLTLSADLNCFFSDFYDPVQQNA